METKKSDTRVLQRLDSSHGKCSSPGPEECFYRQWCYLSASMRLFLPTLVIVIVIWKVVLGSNVYPTRRKDKEVSQVGSVSILLWRSGCQSNITTFQLKGPYQANSGSDSDSDSDSDIGIDSDREMYSDSDSDNDNDSDSDSDSDSEGADHTAGGVSHCLAGCYHLKGVNVQ